jgi:hypothetical protein
MFRVAVLQGDGDTRRLGCCLGGKGDGAGSCGSDCRPDEMGRKAVDLAYWDALIARSGPSLYVAI